MYVSESSINFFGMSVHVMTAEGDDWVGHLDPCDTVDNLVTFLFHYFYPEETGCGPEGFKVVLPRETRTLSENHSVYEEHLEDDDILFFIRRRVNTSTDSDKDLNLKTPTAADIDAATRDLPEPPPKLTPGAAGMGANRLLANHHHQEDSSTETSVDFQLELRKIIISLVSVMATLLFDNPDADLICQQIHSRVKRRLEASNKPLEGTNFQYPPPQEVECSPMGIVRGLMDVRKREFRPNVKAIDALKEMGFQDDQIMDALRANKNSKDAAAEWLVSGKYETENDLDDGLDPNSHLFSALVSAPTIRLGLINPKTLLAYLSILESPAAANSWLNDQDTAPMLSTIFKIYHAEKHAAPPEN